MTIGSYLLSTKDDTDCETLAEKVHVLSLKGGFRGQFGSKTFEEIAASKGLKRGQTI
jgi:hypothetical protein